MPWYAIDAVSDAIEESKSLLLPFDLKRWLVLAVITFFVGGAGSAPSLNQSFGDPTQGGQMPGAPMDGDIWLILGLVLLVVLAIALVFLVVGSIMEFVFVDVLRSHDVRIRGSFGDRTGAGLRLLGFRLALLLIGLVLVALVAAPIYATVVLGTPVALLALVFLVPLVIVVGIALAVVDDFTTAFVVALLCERGGGIVATWRGTLWPAVKAEWQQFLLYIVLKWGLGLAVGFAVGIALAIVFAPVLLLFGAGLFVGGVSAALVVIGVVVAIVLFVVTHVFVQTPIAVFLRYYSLRVLDRSDVEWTLHPDQSVGPDLDDGADDTTDSSDDADDALRGDVEGSSDGDERSP